MILLDIDPNVVKPGWAPLVILVALGIVMVFLFLSMRKQFRKISVGPLAPDAQADDAPESSGRSPGEPPRPTEAAGSAEPTRPSESPRATEPSRPAE